MKTETLKSRLTALIKEFDAVIAEMPDRGDHEEYSKQMLLGKQLKEIQLSVDSIEEKDLVEEELVHVCGECFNEINSIGHSSEHDWEMLSHCPGCGNIEGDNFHIPESSYEAMH